MYLRMYVCTYVCMYVWMNESIMYLCMYPVSQLLYGHDTPQLGLFKESNNRYKLTSRLTLNVVTRTKVHSGQRCFSQISAKTNRTHQQLMKYSPPFSTFVSNHLSPSPTEKTVFFFFKYAKQWNADELDINTNCETGKWSHSVCVGIVIGRNVLRLLGYYVGLF